MHHHALLLLTVQVSVSVYSILFQAALTSPFKMILLLHRTNLQLSENNVSLLLTLAHRFQYISYLEISISLFFQMSTRFCRNSENCQEMLLFLLYLNIKKVPDCGTFSSQNHFLNIVHITTANIKTDSIITAIRKTIGQSSAHAIIKLTISNINNSSFFFIDLL